LILLPLSLPLLLLNVNVVLDMDRFNLDAVSLVVRC
jgi:hypothetical protein